MSQFDQFTDEELRAEIERRVAPKPNMGRCKGCGRRVAEVVNPPGYPSIWAFKDRPAQVRTYICGCGYFHRNSVPLVDKQTTRDRLESEFYSKFIEFLCESSGVPEEVLMTPIDQNFVEPEPDPSPRISLEERVFYAVRSKWTGNILTKGGSWLTENGFGDCSANVANFINLGLCDTQDVARHFSEKAKDDHGNPEPVEIVRYRLVCEGPVKEEHREEVSRDERLLLTCDVVK